MAWFLLLPKAVMVADVAREGAEIESLIHGIAVNSFLFRASARGWFPLHGETAGLWF